MKYLKKRLKKTELKNYSKPRVFKSHKRYNDKHTPMMARLEQARPDTFDEKLKNNCK